VVTSTAAKGDDERKGLSAPAGAADTLLVVKTLGRHVRLIHALQGPNVNPDLHRRCNREHVDFRCELLDFAFAVDEDPLEAPQPFREIVRLSRELFNTQTKPLDALLLAAQYPQTQKVLLPQVPGDARGRRIEGQGAPRAEIEAKMQMYALAVC